MSRKICVCSDKYEYAQSHRRTLLRNTVKTINNIRMNKNVISMIPNSIVLIKIYHCLCTIILPNSIKRLVLYNASFIKDQGDRFSKEAAMAKLFASEIAMDAAINAVQIHGGYGYTKEYTVERLFRDAKITEIYEGTSEVQRLVISSSLLK